MKKKVLILAALVCIVILFLVLKLVPMSIAGRNSAENYDPANVLNCVIPGIWDSSYVIATVRPTDIGNAEEYNKVIDYVTDGISQQYEGVLCRLEYIFNYERFKEHMLENHVFREGEPYPVEDLDGLSMVYFPAGSVRELEPGSAIMFKLEMIFIEDPTKNEYYDLVKKSMTLDSETGISFIRFGGKGLELTYHAIWTGAPYEPIRFYNDYVTSGYKLQEGASVQEAIDYFSAIDRSGYLRYLENYTYEHRQENNQ